MDNLRETCPGITRRKMTKSASLPSGHPFYVQMNESLECMRMASDARKTQTVRFENAQPQPTCSTNSGRRRFTAVRWSGCC